MMAITKEQEATEAFIKEFFKSVIKPDTWKREKRFKLNDGKDSYFQVDGYHKEHKIVWEYDGHGHYNDEEIVERDKRRKAFFQKKYEFIAIPYFCTLTREVVCHYFKRAFEKIGGDFEKALANNYEDAIDKAEEIFVQRKIKVPFRTPGWQGSSNTPFKFSKKGKERFLKEINELPEKTYHQIMHSLTFVLAKASKRTSKNAWDNPLNKNIVEKIRNFKVNKKHTDGWEFPLEEKKS